MKKILACSFILISFSAMAQSDTTIEVESLYDQYEEKETRQREDQQKTESQRRQQNTKFESLGDLSVLAPFEDIAVIQRRFMPKTMRFEVSGSVANSLNNAFFNNWGTTGRIAYYLTENYGLEFSYYWLNSNERPVTENLREKQSVETRSLVVPENYLGLAFKWVPIYGKVAWFNRTIVPFDLYFTAGGGLSGTGLEEKETTLHLGTGQMFFWTKSLGFRWDLGLNYYQAKILQSVGAGVLEEATKNHFDLFLSVGVSFYWPGATYR